jgi:hypothetical protein
MSLVKIWRLITLWISMGLIIFATHTIAATKPMMRDVAGHIVLCTGHGPEIILIAADGQPIEGQPICPECVTSLSDFGANSFRLSQTIIAVTAVVYVQTQEIWGAGPSIDPLSRGPPVFL